jgi:hypothetical protein
MSLAGVMTIRASLGAICIRRSVRCSDMRKTSITTAKSSAGSGFPEPASFLV